MSKKHAFWILALMIGVFAIGRIAWFEFFKTCGNCGLLRGNIAKKAAIDVTPIPAPAPLTCAHCRIEISANNGSVPPQFHRIETYTVYEDSKGGAVAEHKIESGYRNGMGGPTKVLSQEKITIPRDQFQSMVSDVLKVNPQNNANALTGCTGGSSESLTVYDDDKAILKTGNYRCAGQESNPSLGTFSGEVEILFTK